MTRALALIALAALAAADVRAEPSPPSPGDKRRIVAVLDVTVTGVPSEVKEQFLAGLDAQVDEKRFWIAPRNYVREKMMSSTKWTEGCLVGSCLAEVRAQTRADLVLLVAINGSGTSFGSVVTLVRTDTGAVVSQESERCDVCTVNEALTTATLATLHLLGNISDKLPDERADHAAAVEAAVAPLRAQLAARKHARTRIGVALSITGLVAVAAGVVLYLTNNGVNTPMSTAGFGIATAGGALTTGGVVVLAF